MANRSSCCLKKDWLQYKSSRPFSGATISTSGKLGSEIVAITSPFVTMLPGPTNISRSPPSPTQQVEPPALSLNLGLLGFFGITFNALRTFKQP